MVLFRQSLKNNPKKQLGENMLTHIMDRVLEVFPMVSFPETSLELPLGALQCLIVFLYLSNVALLSHYLLNMRIKLRSLAAWMLVPIVGWLLALSSPSLVPETLTIAHRTITGTSLLLAPITMVACIIFARNYRKAIVHHLDYAAELKAESKHWMVRGIVTLITGILTILLGLWIFVLVVLVWFIVISIKFVRNMRTISEPALD